MKITMSAVRPTTTAGTMGVYLLDQDETLYWAMDSVVRKVFKGINRDLADDLIHEALALLAKNPKLGKKLRPLMVPVLASEEAALLKKTSEAKAKIRRLLEIQKIKKLTPELKDERRDIISDAEEMFGCNDWNPWAPQLCGYALKCVLFGAKPSAKIRELLGIWLSYEEAIKSSAKFYTQFKAFVSAIEAGQVPIKPAGIDVTIRFSIKDADKMSDSALRVLNRAGLISEPTAAAFKAALSGA